MGFGERFGIETIQRIRGAGLQRGGQRAMQVPSEPLATGQESKAGRQFADIQRQGHDHTRHLSVGDLAGIYAVLTRGDEHGNIEEPGIVADMREKKQRLIERFVIIDGDNVGVEGFVRNPCAGLEVIRLQDGIELGCLQGFGQRRDRSAFRANEKDSAVAGIDVLYAFDVYFDPGLAGAVEPAPDLRMHCR